MRRLWYTALLAAVALTATVADAARLGAPEINPPRTPRRSDFWSAYDDVLKQFGVQLEDRRPGSGGRPASGGGYSEDGLAMLRNIENDVPIHGLLTGIRSEFNQKLAETSFSNDVMNEAGTIKGQFEEGKMDNVESVKEINYSHVDTSANEVPKPNFRNRNNLGISRINVGVTELRQRHAAGQHMLGSSDNGGNRSRASSSDNGVNHTTGPPPSVTTPWPTLPEKTGNTKSAMLESVISSVFDNQDAMNDSLTVKQYVDDALESLTNLPKNNTEENPKESHFLEVLEQFPRTSLQRFPNNPQYQEGTVNNVNLGNLPIKSSNFFFQPETQSDAEYTDDKFDYNILALKASFAAANNRQEEDSVVEELVTSSRIDDDTDTVTESTDFDHTDFTDADESTDATVADDASGTDADESIDATVADDTSGTDADESIDATVADDASGTDANESTDATVADDASGIDADESSDITVADDANGIDANAAKPAQQPTPPTRIFLPEILSPVASPSSSSGGQETSSYQTEAPLTGYGQLVRLVQHPSRLTAGVLDVVNTVGVVGGVVSLSFLLPLMVGKKRRRRSASDDDETDRLPASLVAFADASLMNVNKR